MSIFRNYRVAAPTFSEAIIAAAGASLYQFQDGHAYTESAGVLTWTDLSGNGRHMSAVTVARSPTPSTDPLMGDVLDFDGSSDYLTSVVPKAEYTLLHDGSNRAVFQVSTQNSLSAFPYATADNALKPGIRTGAFASSPSVWSANVYKTSGTAASDQTPTDVPTGQPIMTCDSVMSGELNVTAIDEDGTFYSTAPATLVTPDLIAPDNDLHLGANAGGGSRCTGPIACFIILDNPTMDQLRDVCGIIQEYKLQSTPELIFDLDVDNATVDGANDATLLPDSSTPTYDFGLGVKVDWNGADADFNGHDSLEPSGNTENLRNVTVPIAPAWTLFFVGTYVNSSGGLVKYNSADTSNGYGISRLTSSLTMSLADEAGGSVDATPTPTAQPFVAVATFTGGAMSSIEVHSDGSAPNITFGTLSPSPTQTGAWVMTNRALSSKWEGKAARFVHYNGVMKASDVASIVATLKAKYGVVTI